MSLSNETFWDELFNPLKRVNYFQASSGTPEVPLTYLFIDARPKMNWLREGRKEDNYFLLLRSQMRILLIFPH